MRTQSRGRDTLPALWLGALLLGGCGEEKGPAVLPADDAQPCEAEGPLLLVEPDAVDFGPVVVGDLAARTVRLTNRSCTDLDVELLGGLEVKRCSAGLDEPGAFCVRIGNRNLGPTSELALAPGQVAELELGFAPIVAGTRTNGFIALRTCASAACETRIGLTGLAVEAGLRCRPPTLDFGQLNPGASASRTVTCENVLNEPVTLVSWALTPDSNPAFEVEPPRPQVLDQNDTVTVEATHSPTALGDANGTLRFETGIPNSHLRYIDVALRGTGGGPDIQVLPRRLDFGRGSLIAPARRPVLITNTGFAPLAVREIVVDTEGTGSFSSPDASANVLQPGESQKVTVEFTPRTEGLIESMIRVTSNDADEPTVEVVVRGGGVNLRPCNFSVVPSMLDFGTVARTRSLRRSFEIRNDSDPAEPENVCLITAVRLLATSDRAFSLPGGDLISREIPPGAAETVEVEFRPGVAGTATGQVEFSISSPTQPFNIVDLVGDCA